MTAERRTIIFTGRVQGVGFRMTTVHLADGLAVSGTVRNLPDGRVELVVQGDTQEIEVLLTRLREHFGAFIRTISQAGGVVVEPETPGIRVVYD